MDTSYPIISLNTPDMYKLQLVANCNYLRYKYKLFLFLTKQTVLQSFTNRFQQECKVVFNIPVLLLKTRSALSITHTSIMTYRAMLRKVI